MADELQRIAGRALLTAGRGEEIRARFDVWSKEVAEVAELAAEVPERLESPQHLRDAAHVAGWAKGITDRVDSQRKAWTKPLRDMIALVNRMCAETIAPAKRATMMMKARIVEYEAQLEKIAQQTAEELGTTPAVPLATAGTPASVRRGWRYEVVDLDLVPRKYLILDTTLLNSYARKRDAPPEIPGIKWVEAKTVSVRAT